MTRRSWQQKGSSKTVVKTIEQQPIKFATAICPLNIEEQKERFLKYGKLPKFIFKGSESDIENVYQKPTGQIRFDLFGEAEFILNTVKEKFGDSAEFYNEAYGEKITKEEATETITKYLEENNLSGAMNIVWCNELICAARMMWVGPHCKFNKPEARSFSFWIRNTSDNHYLRKNGIRCLADHEIGTHFFRSFNDGLQPWYTDRRRFSIRGLGSLDLMRTEEGLAAIHTILNSKVKYLWGPALQYYAACKAAEMTFKQLFDHLSKYSKNEDHRWRLCMRIKRGLLDPNDLGGIGKDQCYFEGAVEILRNIDNIDFHILMSGKLCIDEIARCKRLARMDCIRIPAFMRNVNKYKKSLKAIAGLNGLNVQHPKIQPPPAYVQRLRRGRRIGPENSRKVRKKYRGPGKGRHKVQRSDSVTSLESSESDYDESSFDLKQNANGELESKVSGSEKIPKKFLTDSSVDNSILSDLESTYSEKSHFELKLDGNVKTGISCFDDNNNANTLVPGADLYAPSELSQASLGLASSGYGSRFLRSGVYSNSVCTTIIREDTSVDLVDQSQLPGNFHFEKRYSSMSLLQDFRVPQLQPRSLTQNPLFPVCSAQSQNSDKCTNVKTVCESGPENFIYPDRSDLFESESVMDGKNSPPPSATPLPRVKSEYSNPQIQMPKLLEKRAKSAANRLPK